MTQKVRITITRELSADHYLVSCLWDTNGNLLPLRSESMSIILAEEYTNGGIDISDLLDEVIWKVEVVEMTEQVNNFEAELQVLDAPPEYYRAIAFGLLAERGKLLQRIGGLTAGWDSMSQRVNELTVQCDNKYNLGKRDGYREAMFAIEGLIEGVG